MTTFEISKPAGRAGTLRRRITIGATALAMGIATIATIGGPTYDGGVYHAEPLDPPGDEGDPPPAGRSYVHIREPLDPPYGGAVDR